MQAQKSAKKFSCMAANDGHQRLAGFVAWTQVYTRRVSRSLREWHDDTSGPTKVGRVFIEELDKQPFGAKPSRGTRLSTAPRSRPERNHPQATVRQVILLSAKLVQLPSCWLGAINDGTHVVFTRDNIPCACATNFIMGTQLLLALEARSSFLWCQLSLMPADQTSRPASWPVERSSWARAFAGEVDPLNEGFCEAGYLGTLPAPASAAR